MSYSYLLKNAKSFFENTEYYLQIVKDVVKKSCGSDSEIFLFGSIVRGDFIIGKSDIDVLVVSEEAPKTISGQTQIRIKALREIGDIAAPFEIHFADKKTFERWYKGFIKNDIIKA